MSRPSYYERLGQIGRQDPGQYDPIKRPRAADAGHARNNPRYLAKMQQVSSEDLTRVVSGMQRVIGAIANQRDSAFP